MNYSNSAISSSTSDANAGTTSDLVGDVDITTAPSAGSENVNSVNLNAQTVRIMSSKSEQLNEWRERIMNIQMERYKD